MSDKERMDTLSKIFFLFHQGKLPLNSPLVNTLEQKCKSKDNGLFHQPASLVPNCFLLLFKGKKS